MIIKKIEDKYHIGHYNPKTLDWESITYCDDLKTAGDYLCFLNGGGFATIELTNGL